MTKEKSAVKDEGATLTDSGENTVKKGKKGVRVVVNVDSTVEEVLDYDKKGFLIDFDVDNFLELSEEDTRQLSHANARNYFVAEGTVKERERVPERNPRKMYKEDWEAFLRSPLEGRTRERMQIRERRGWHQCWKSPAERSAALDVGYKLVRKPTKEQKEKGYKPGEEKGETLILGAREEPELFAMEVRQELYEQHLLAMSYQSTGMYDYKQQEWVELVKKAGYEPFVAKDEEEED